jgi:hypothetical protein
MHQLLFPSPLKKVSYGRSDTAHCPLNREENAQGIPIFSIFFLCSEHYTVVQKSILPSQWRCNPETRREEQSIDRDGSKSRMKT